MPPSRPRASVLLTVAGSTPPPLLEQAVRSVLTQTMSDLELIVVCDGDLEPAHEEVLGNSTDPRMTVLRPGRIGRGEALNLAVASSSAPYLAIQDADDESHPRRLAIQVEAMDADPDLALLGTEAQKSHELGPATWEDIGEPGPPKPISWQVLVTNPLVHTSVMMRREPLEAVGAYDAGRSWQFDHDLYIRLNEQGHELAKLRVPLVSKRFHDAQAFERGGAEARLSSSHQLQLAAVRRRPTPTRIPLMAIATSRHLIRRVVSVLRSR